LILSKIVSFVQLSFKFDQTGRFSGQRSASGGTPETYFFLTPALSVTGLL